MKHGVRIAVVLMVVVLAVSCVLIALLPERVPMHYNMAGEMDRVGSRYEMLIFPGSAILLGAFMLWASKRLTKKPDEQKVLVIMSILFELLLGGIGIYYMCSSMSYDPESAGSEVSSGEIVRLSCIFIGVMMVVLGCIIPKVGRNSYIGLRTKWSMHNDSVWRKSQRFGGISSVILGGLIITAACVLEQPVIFPVLIVLAVFWLIADVLASYVYYRREVSHEQ